MLNSSIPEFFSMETVLSQWQFPLRYSKLLIYKEIDIFCKALFSSKLLIYKEIDIFCKSPFFHTFVSC